MHHPGAIQQPAALACANTAMPLGLRAGFRLERSVYSSGCSPNVAADSSTEDLLLKGENGAANLNGHREQRGSYKGVKFAIGAKKTHLQSSIQTQYHRLSQSLQRNLQMAASPSCQSQVDGTFIHCGHADPIRPNSTPSAEGRAR